MISADKLFEILSGSDITKEEVEKILFFARESYKYYLAGSVADFKILKTNEKYLWPYFSRSVFSDPKSSIYKKAFDWVTVAKFIETIRDEKKLKSGGPSRFKWSDLESILQKRIKLFPSVFVFSKDDLRSCESEARKLCERLARRKKHRRFVRFKKGAIISAGITAGVGTIVYLLGKVGKSSRKKTEKDR